MADIPADELARARAIIDQLHERLRPVADELSCEEDLAVRFDPEQPA